MMKPQKYLKTSSTNEVHISEIQVMKNKANKLILLLTVLVMQISGWLTGQEITGLKTKYLYRLDQPDLSLKQRIKQAEQKHSRDFKQGYFITGFLFESRCNAKISGCYIISHTQTISRISNRNDRLIINHFGSSRENNRDPAAGMVDREVIFLHRKTSQGSVIVDLALLAPDGFYEITALPFYWLGNITANDSMPFLKQLFRSGNNKLKERLMAVIACQNHPAATTFLYQVVKDQLPLRIRKNAVFWLGIVKDRESFVYLKKISSEETEADIRQQLVFALYLHDSSEANSELVNIARNDKSVSLRKKAIFWLGQRASKQAIKTLQEVITSEDVLTVKSSAVFALSQLPRNKAVPLLIDIARNNKSVKIRKKAIFWLSEIGDEQAVKFFEEILLK